jgi:hypothetical protein
MFVNVKTLIVVIMYTLIIVGIARQNFINMEVTGITTKLQCGVFLIFIAQIVE